MREMVVFRIQAADLGREFPWQHHHRAVDKIDAVAAFEGFLVNQRSGENIGRDIGNVHANFNPVKTQWFRQSHTTHCLGGLKSICHEISNRNTYLPN